MSPDCARCRAAIDEFTSLDRSSQRATLDHATNCRDCGRALDDARRVTAYVRGLVPASPAADLLPRLLAAPHQARPTHLAHRRIVPLVAILALLGAAITRDLWAPGTPLAAPVPTPVTFAASATQVARTAMLDLVTPRLLTSETPDVATSPPASNPVVAQAPSVARPTAPVAAIEPTETAPPPGATVDEPRPPHIDEPTRAVPTDEPTPSTCGSITVRVFMDLAGADGGPCGGCDGRLTAEDMALGQALGLQLPRFQLAVYTDDDAARRVSSEENIVEVGQVVTRTIDVPCDLAGQLVVEIGGDLGPWQPCAASAGVRQLVAMPGDHGVDFALTTTCAPPTPTPLVTPGGQADPSGATPTPPSTTPATPPPAGPPPDRALDLP